MTAGTGSSLNGTSYTHDSLGRVATSTQTTAGVAFNPFRYTYSLADELTQLQYPSGRQLNYTLDAGGRVSALSTSAVTYVASVGYNPDGTVSTMNFGNGLTEQHTFNDRLQLTGLALNPASGTSLLSLALYPCVGQLTSCSTGNTGNVQSQGIAVPGSAWTQTYGNDSLYRLTSASEATGSFSQGYGYDSNQNWFVSSNSGFSLSAFTPTTASNFDTRNRLGNNGASYDGSGIGTQTAIGGYSYVYDAENRITTATLSNLSSVGFTYDGQGQRVQKITCPAGTSPCNPGSAGAVVSTTYAYDAGGNLMAEYGTSGPTPCPTATCYLFQDHLGSTRLLTDASGNVAKRYDYLPFREEVPAGVGSRATAMGYGSAGDGFSIKFTGKERDSETGLDYFGARYFSSAQGRFTSPDWSAVPQPVPYANLSDPQTLNLYSYVRNNPLRTADLDGHCGLDWNCWSQFGSGVADTTYRPIVQAVSHPIDTLGALGSAAMHPINTAVAVKNAVVDTASAALSGDPKAIGQVTGTVLSAVVTAGVGKAATAVVQGAEVGEASTALFRAVGSAEAESIGAKSAFTAAPNGTEFKGFFFNQSDAQGFGTRMTQMTGDTHTVVQGEAPTSLINASPPHTAATEGPGVLIRNQNLPQVKVKLPDQP